MNNQSIRLCALALTASATMLAQESGGTVSPSAETSQPAFDTSTSRSPVRFEGTDLMIGKLPPISFHGFASQGLLLSSDYDYLGKTTDLSAQFNEFGLNASMSPFQRTRIAAQVFAFDLGKVGNHSLMLDYALVDYSFNDAIGIRGGRIRRPAGIYNHIQDIDVARTFVLLPQSVYDARWRDFAASLDGGSIYGNIGMGGAGDLSYEAYGGLIRLADEGGISRLIEGSLPPPPVAEFDSVEGSVLVGAQLWWATPVDGLRAGLMAANSFGLESNYSVNPPFGPGRMRDEIDTFVLHYSLEYVVNSWTFQAEYTTQNSSSETHSDFGLAETSRGRTEGWYASAAYRFNNWLEVGTYYSEYYSNANDHDGSEMAVPSDAYQRDLALAFRFDPKPWWVLKLEGHWLNGTALLDDDRANPSRSKHDWFMLAAKTTFSF